MRLAPNGDVCSLNHVAGCYYLTQIVLRRTEELEEHRREIRQIYARMAEHETRFEAMSRDIRRFLDAMERRGGNGGNQPE